MVMMPRGRWGLTSAPRILAAGCSLFGLMAATLAIRTLAIRTVTMPPPMRTLAVLHPIVVMIIIAVLVRPSSTVMISLRLPV